MSDQCLDPSRIREGDLLAILDGTAPPEVREHVKRCKACAAELAALAKIDAAVYGASYRASCPAPTELLEYDNGLLTRSEQNRIKRHLKACSECQHELDQLHTPISTSDSEPFIERLHLAGRQILMAAIVPAMPQPGYVFRGAQRRQSVYQAEDYKIAFAVAPPLAAENVWQVEGQVLRRNQALPADYEAVIHLVHNGRTIVEDRVDDLGFFALDNVRPGGYTVQIDMPTTDLVIPNFSVP